MQSNSTILRPLLSVVTALMLMLALLTATSPPVVAQEQPPSFPIDVTGPPGAVAGDTVDLEITAHPDTPAGAALQITVPGSDCDAQEAQTGIAITCATTFPAGSDGRVDVSAEVNDDGEPIMASVQEFAFETWVSSVEVTASVSDAVMVDGETWWEGGIFTSVALDGRGTLYDTRQAVDGAPSTEWCDDRLVDSITLPASQFHSCSFETTEEVPLDFSYEARVGDEAAELRELGEASATVHVTEPAVQLEVDADLDGWDRQGLIDITMTVTNLGGFRIWDGLIHTELSELEEIGRIFVEGAPPYESCLRHFGDDPQQEEPAETHTFECQVAAEDVDGGLSFSLLTWLPDEILPVYEDGEWNWEPHATDAVTVTVPLAGQLVGEASTVDGDPVEDVEVESTLVAATEFAAPAPGSDGCWNVDGECYEATGIATSAGTTAAALDAAATDTTVVAGTYTLDGLVPGEHVVTFTAPAGYEFADGSTTLVVEEVMVGAAAWYYGADDLDVTLVPTAEPGPNRNPNRNRSPRSSRPPRKTRSRRLPRSCWPRPGPTCWRSG